MIDWQGQLYDPLYSAFGVTASLDLDDSDSPYSLTVVDRTAGLVMTDAGNVDVQTVLPAALVRMSELTENGIAAAGLDGREIAFNGKTWRVESTRPKPSPEGEATGELVLLLIEAP